MPWDICVCLMNRHSFDPLGDIYVYCTLTFLCIFNQFTFANNFLYWELCSQRRVRKFCFLLRPCILSQEAKVISVLLSESSAAMELFKSAHSFPERQGYSLAAQVKRCFILQIYIYFIPCFTNGIWYAHWS